MNWILIPIEDLKQFDKDWKTRRTNNANTEAVLHELIYNELVLLTTRGKEIEYPFTMLDQLETIDLMDTVEWTKQ